MIANNGPVTQMLLYTIVIAQKEKKCQQLWTGGTFGPFVYCRIQKKTKDIEFLKQERPRRGAKMGQIYSVLRDLLRQYKIFEKLKKFQKAW